MTIDEIKKGENSNLEFKVAHPEKSIKFVKTVVAFSNTVGGKLVFGIADDTHEVVGIPENIVFKEMDANFNAINQMKRS